MRLFSMRNVTFGVILIVSVFVNASFVFPNTHLRIIENPKPNMVENEFEELKFVGEIGDSPGQNIFLFYPSSIAISDKNFIFVYDSMQTKILCYDPSLKFIKAFGRQGQGPGEFSTKGRSASVLISMGLDGNLYCHDSNAMKVVVYNTQGKHLKDIKYAEKTQFKVPYRYPIANKAGDLVLQVFKDNKLTVFTQQDEVLFSLENKERKKEHLFCPDKMVGMAAKKSGFMQRRMPFFYDLYDIKMRLTSESILLLYFNRSATMYVVDKNKHAKKIRIWPKEALEIRREMNSDAKYGFAPMFSQLFTDGDQKEVFYLNFGKNRSRGQHLLYKFNLSGDLVRVLYVSIENHPGSLKFVCKKNSNFYAIDKEKIKIFRRAE